ncbi:MAG: DUF6328 family protein [Candidatus Micrarchaeia archaeon]|jgi:hypothetical protein
MDQKKQLERLSEEPSYLGSHELTHNLTDVMAEGRTMLSAVGLLFAFLLNTAIVYEQSATHPNEFLILLSALLLSAVSLMLFSMPVIYHHLEFPYRNQEKFILRSHNFISWGLVFFVITVFLGLALAFYRKLGWYSFLLALATFAFLGVIYRLRAKEFFVRNRPQK